MRRTTTATTMAAIDSSIITRNSVVLRPIVSGSPIAGGLAGYLSTGTTYTPTKPSNPSTAAVPRAVIVPSRPYAAGEHEGEQATEGDAVEDRARTEAARVLHGSADRRVLARLVVHVVLRRTPRTRSPCRPAAHRGCARRRTRASPRQVPRACPAAEGCEPGTGLRCSVAGEAQEVTSVVDELVDLTPPDERHCALFRIRRRTAGTAGTRRRRSPTASTRERGCVWARERSGESQLRPCAAATPSGSCVPLERSWRLPGLTEQCSSQWRDRVGISPTSGMRRVGRRVFYQWAHGCPATRGTRAESATKVRFARRERRCESGAVPQLSPGSEPPRRHGRPAGRRRGATIWEPGHRRASRRPRGWRWRWTPASCSRRSRRDGRLSPRLHAAQPPTTGSGCRARPLVTEPDALLGARAVHRGRPRHRP